MSLITLLRNLIRHGTDTFSKLEMAVLDELIGELPSETATRLRTRVSKINLVQRLDGGREVNCYEMQGGKAVLDPETRLLERSGELPFAHFRLETNEGQKNAGNVWLVDGYLFSLEFEEPTEHMMEASINSVRVELLTRADI